MRIELKGIHKRFLTLRGRVEAVRGVDLTVESGEFFVLLGPSGCGKSTLLNLLAGLERPTDGEIRFGERPVASAPRKLFLPPRERKVAMVFQSYALYPHLSVFENIAFPLKIGGAQKPEVDRGVREAASTLGIEELLERRPGELSGGQRQRVAIARAIVRRPDLFLLDEPLSNLDARLRSDTRVELKRLQKRLGITTIYVTHDQVEAMTLGDRIALLRGGRVEQVGPPSELYHRPENPFVAGFVGTPPMNLLPAVVQGGRLHLGEVILPLPPGQPRDPPFRECLFGIRPEDLSLERREVGEPLTGRLESVEPLGREDLLHIRLPAVEVTVLGDAKKGRIGETVVLYPDLSRSHLFAAEKKDSDGKSISSEQA